MTLSPSSSHGLTPVLAVVERTSGAISDWDGSAVPFNTVVFDPYALWSVVDKQFTIKKAGWYLVTTNAPGSSGGISVAATASNGTASLTAQVFGAGLNLNVFISNHTAVASGSWFFPPIVGYTHLDIGDGVALTGDGGTGWTVGNGAGFAIQLAVAS